MEFKTKAALTEWANDQTMAEIAAYYNGLASVKPVKKFESLEVAVTRIGAVLSPGPADRPKVALRDYYRLNLEKQATYNWNVMFTGC
jgi:hypothetical protein